jgi:hypothetical protein
MVACAMSFMFRPIVGKQERGSAHRALNDAFAANAAAFHHAPVAVLVAVPPTNRRMQKNDGF